MSHRTGRIARRVAHLIIILLAAASVVPLTGCSMGGSGQGDEATPTPIPTPIIPTKPTYVVAQGEVVRKIDFTGRVAPVVEEELFFRASGYVDIVYFKRNDQVQEGDLIAELEVTDLKNALAQAEASLATTMANNDERIAEAQASLRATELRLAQAQAQDPSPQVTILRINVQRALEAVEDAKEYRQDVADQYWRRDLEEALDAADRAIMESERNVVIAQANLQQAEQGVEVHQYGLQILEQEVDLAELRLEQLQSGFTVEEMRLNVERLRAQLDDAQILAPFDGVLLSVGLVEGRAVEAYRPVIVIADPAELEVSADLTDRQMRDLVEGMPATAAPVSSPGDVVGAEVRRLPYPYGGGGRSQGVGEEDKSTRVTLDVDFGKSGFELGDLVRVTVVLEAKQDVLWLPPQAIRTFEGRRFVVVQEEDAQRRVDVNIGIQGEDRVEIEEGLSEGDVVLGQ
jgi:RND family efflux transporter MFP subunit